MSIQYSNNIDQPPATLELVSVIIPNYNHAQYLGDAIQSVLNQDYPTIEVIVVDDGSTDNSREVAAAFGDQICYLWQQNSGLSAARNTGIRAATGAYIGLLDADDMYEPTFVSTLVTRLQAEPNVDGIYCGYQFVDHTNRPLPQIEARSIPPEQLHQALVDGNFLVPEAMFVRRHCYTSTDLFDESLRACEDWDMWLAITRQHHIIGTDQLLTRHRILPGSMSTDPKRMLDNRMQVLSKHFGPEPAIDNAWTAAQRRAYSHGYLTSAVEHLQVGDLEGTYRCMRRMAQIYPDLLAELGTFYELGCGAQPKGHRAHFASLDLQRSSRELLLMMDRLFSESEPTNYLSRYRAVAYGQAYYALGLLHYGARELGAARAFLLRALTISPQLMVRRDFVMIMLGSLAGKSVIMSLRHLRQRGLVRSVQP